MKIRMDECINAYEAGLWFLEQPEVPSRLSFQIAELIAELQTKRESFLVATKKMKRDEQGQLDAEEFADLCEIEVDIKADQISKETIIEGFEKIPPKVFLALMPLIGKEKNDA